jgi:tripartite-type tricarboxylate transporter receptor subunit TctC
MLHAVRWIGTVAVAGALAAGAACAAYPERAVTIIVPFAAGGGSDIVARVLSKYLTESFGKSVIVENRAGAGGNIGIAAAARAKPDGYTLLVVSSVLVVNPSLYKQAPFDPFKDFVPVVDIGASPNVIVTRADSAIKSVADLIALAKKNPNLLNYSSPGSGTSPHLATELFKYRAEINLTHVPYSGAGPSMQAVLGGAVQLGAFSLGSAGVHMTNGTLRALVHTGAGRMPDFPTVPNMTEAGFPNSDSETFQVLVAPAGTPQDVIDRVAKDVIAILTRPDVRETLKQTGFGVIAGGPDVLRKRIAREVPMWKDVIERANIKAE